MVSQLLTKLRTKDDLDILRGELYLLENSLYQTTNKYDNTIRNDIRNWVSDILLQESKDIDISKYIKDLKNDLQEIPVLTASMNFEPSSSFVETVSTWIKGNVDERIVIDILLNTSTLGGVQLSYRGKYLDLSLRKRISAELENVTLTGINKLEINVGT